MRIFMLYLLVLFAGAESNSNNSQRRGPDVRGYPHPQGRVNSPHGAGAHRNNNYPPRNGPNIKTYLPPWGNTPHGAGVQRNNPPRNGASVKTYLPPWGNTPHGVDAQRNNNNPLWRGSNVGPPPRGGGGAESSFCGPYGCNIPTEPKCEDGRSWDADSQKCRRAMRK